MSSIEDGANASTVAVGWLYSDEARSWRRCTICLSADELTIEVDFRLHSVVDLAVIRGVDEVAEPLDGQLTVELATEDHPTLRLACPADFVSLLIERLLVHSQRSGPASDPRAVVASAAAAMSERSATTRLGGRRALEAEVERLRAALAAMGVEEQLELAEQLEATRTEIAALRLEATRELEERRADVEADLSEQQRRAEARLAVLQQQTTRFQRAAERARATALAEEAALAEARVAAEQYERTASDRTPRCDASTLADPRLEAVRQRIGGIGLSGGAIAATTNRSVGLSPSQGRTLVHDVSKLMLRAYDAEADRLAQTMQPGALRAAVGLLAASRDAINSVSRTVGIVVAPPYHQLRVEELELVAELLDGAGAPGSASCAPAGLEQGEPAGFEVGADATVIDLRDGPESQAVGPTSPPSRRGARRS